MSLPPKKKKKKKKNVSPTQKKKKKKPVIALGHVIDIVHQALEVLSFTKGAISDAAQQLQESVSVSRPHKGWTQVQDQSLMHS